MSANRRLQLLVIVDDPPAAGWHCRVLATLRAEGVDVEIAPHGQIASTADLVIDLVGGASPQSPVPIWRYGFGDGAVAAHGAHGTLVRLYRLGPNAGQCTMLREGWYRLDSDDAPGVEDVGACVAPWCALAVRQLLADGEAFETAPVVSMAGCDRLQPPADRSGTVARARDAIRRWRRRERWTVGFAATTVEEILATGSLHEPSWVTGTANDCYLADPFPIAVDGDSLSLLAEQYHYRSGRGRIVRIDAGRDGLIRRTCTVAEAPHHLAYPFVLRDGASLVCIPDASASGQTYACPVEAVHSRRTLISNFAAVDPTLVQHAGRWWLFCTPHGPMNQTDLYVFEAESWHGPWRPHPLNPVKCDARSSRPAGALFVHNGALFRPAQDCSRRYGGAVAINRILELSSSTFHEETVCTLKPAATWQWPDGLHTFNVIADVVVVDALRVER